MNNEMLAKYVAERNQKGISKALILEELIAVGWSEEEAEDAYRAGLVLAGIPVPSEGNTKTVTKKSSTVDIVINFFSFILLGIIATALGTLLFGIINKFFPDQLDVMNMYYGEASASSSIHYAISALIISFPLYYFSLRLWFRTFREDEGRTESKLSQWLTYLVLLVTAVTIVGDLITVIYTLLQGEITMRFFLKALTILVIAGIVFGFYYLERRKIQYHIDIPRKVFITFGRGVTAFLFLSLVLGFLASGSPEAERERTFDRTRSNNLSSLADCIESYAGTFGKLPEAFADLTQTSQFSYCSNYMRDPETSLSYEYRIVNPLRMEGEAKVGDFELCAQFALPSETSATLSGSQGSVWYEHPAGKSCSTMKAQLLVPIFPRQ